jgi:hypothetical protein
VTAFERVKLRPAARADLLAITDPDVRKAVVEAMLIIEDNLEFGRLLEDNDSTGDLRGCRKVYVDKPGPGKPRYRLVYWLAPSEASPRRAHILAIGKRQGLRAYELAVERYNDDRATQGVPPVEQLTDAELGLAAD